MRDAHYGRVLMTTSISGIYGNFGQANYAAAKLGLIGLAQSLALEGASRNIMVNSIAPTAASRLTAAVLPSEVLEILRPEYVTPTVILLTHETSPVTGKLFEVGGGCVSQVRWEQTEGVYFEHPFSAEELRDDWDRATSFENSRHGASISETRSGVEERLGRKLVLAPQR